MKKLLFIISGILAIYSCKSGRNFVIENERDIKYSQLIIDTINVNIENTSLSGEFMVDNENLYFIDSYSGILYRITSDGEVLDKALGLGRGPNEIPMQGPYAVTIKDNDLLILGSTYDYYISKDLTQVERKTVRVPDYEASHKNYQAYTSYSELLRANSTTLFYNIYSERELSNPFEHSKDYFAKSHIIMAIDRSTGVPQPIGNYSQYYMDNHSVFRHLFNITYDLDKNSNFIVSYEADSLIYVFNEEFAPIKAFGFEGRNMDKNYTPTLPNIESVNEAYANDIVNKGKGVYYSLEYIDETDMTFRCYKRGNHTDKNGLQIYKGHTLIADIDIPEGFKVIGYLSPYYIAQITSNELDEPLRFYRFKL